MDEDYMTMMVHLVSKVFYFYFSFNITDALCSHALGFRCSNVTADTAVH